MIVSFHFLLFMLQCIFAVYAEGKYDEVWTDKFSDNAQTW